MGWSHQQMAAGVEEAKPMLLHAPCVHCDKSGCRPWVSLYFVPATRLLRAVMNVGLIGLHAVCH